MIEDPDFEQDYGSRTVIGKFEIGDDIIRPIKWICYCDRSSYDDIN